MATGLESQLIRGAGQAVAKDPYGLVQSAQDAAATKITSGLMTIGTKLAEKKKERELEEEKLQKEKEDELKSFEKNSAYKVKVLKEDIKEKEDELSGIQSLANKTEDEVINWNKKVAIEKNRVEEEKKNIARVKENFAKWKVNILEDIARLKLKNKINNINKAGLAEILNSK